MSFISQGHAVTFAEAPGSPKVHFNEDGVAAETEYLIPAEAPGKLVSLQPVGPAGIGAAWLCVDLLGYAYFDDKNQGLLTRVLPAYFGGWVGWAVAANTLFCRSAYVERWGDAKVSEEDLSRAGQGCNSHEWYRVRANWSTKGATIGWNRNGPGVANNTLFGVGPSATDISNDFQTLFFTDWTSHTAGRDTLLNQQIFEFLNLKTANGKVRKYNEKIPFPFVHSTIKAVRRQARDYTVAIGKLAATLNLEPIKGFPSGTLRLLGGSSREVSTSLGLTVYDTDLEILYNPLGHNKFIATDPITGPAVVDTLVHSKTRQNVYPVASWMALWA